ncbi:GNAT family N-acetyltransferase [Evansella halocellulosilytica]|uniref:GNAT family N-acetyltransferase n=1 Tax=Evansella halocellulosilytica TaxID=2011013 RepID=UPI000BB7EAEC|nr:GNAT family protein [Evansella halocellulosilytica]
MNIRVINVDDAQQFIELNKQLDEETSFMLYERGERKTTVEKQENMIKNIRESKEKEIYVVESDDHQLIGYIALFGGSVERNRHSAYIVIGILLSHQGKGIGTKLFDQAHEWAVDNGIHRLELTVMKHNEHAINLYMKQGFEVEGVKRHSLKLDGEYIDEYYLSKLL